MKKPSICISPIDWGLGHATRCISLIQSLQTLGYEVYIATEGYQEAILKEAFPNAHILKYQMMMFLLNRAHYYQINIKETC